MNVWAKQLRNYFTKGNIIKLLILDIETAPCLAHVWSLWKQNVAINQIMDGGYVLCWAAKWYGEETVYFDSVHRNEPKMMLQNIHNMISESDAVIHFNGTEFDLPTLNREFLLNGILPPPPVKQIDLLVTVKANFRFPSNKLDYVSRRLGIGQKTKHEGHELWVKCMAGDNTAWKTMQEYNEHDVLLTEQVYDKLFPWIKNHPFKNVLEGLEHACPKCGSKNLQSRGYDISRAFKYRRYQCKDCGSWSRAVQRDAESMPAKNRTVLI